MSTARLDSLITEGTSHTFRPVRMADGYTLSLIIEAGADTASAVYLWPGLDAPAADGWENEDPAEIFLTGGDMNGRAFCDVPVQALRDLIEQHGGAAPAADGDEVVTAPLAQLRAAGVRCLPWGDPGGRYVRVPLADGTQITFTGITALDEGGRVDDVSTHHLVSSYGGWTACWDVNGESATDLYASRGRNLPYEEDTAALVAAILDRVGKSGGSAPEEGERESAEQLAIKAFAEWGLAVHPDEDAGNTWLVVGHPATGAIPGDDEPYILLGLYNWDDDEWVMDRPPVRPGDEWHVVTGDATGVEKTLTTRPAAQLADCIETIVDWLTAPRD
ncbi:hypothetical protein ACFW2D_17825 [Streptomyces sp. NPDC058914]|uniref:hypothetical protein n=1 Tax=Streptomyces sp. NPDC058914 TaxID=3346671 RepID=UPI003684C25C